MVNRSDKKIEIKAVRKENLVGIIRRVYERFIRIRGEPREVALGFALGLFVGMTPTMGVQTPFAIFLAALFQWSKLSAAVGVWISNPLTAPVIYGITYITGAKLMHLDPVFTMPLSPTWSTLKAMLLKAPQAFGAMTVGGVILGLPLAILGFYLSYAALRKYQKDLKAKLARQKAKLTDTKEKVKKKVLEHKMQRTEDGLLKSEVGMQNGQGESSVHRVKATGGQPTNRDRRQNADEGYMLSGARCQVSSGCGQRAEDVEQRTEDRTQITADRGQK